MNKEIIKVQKVYDFIMCVQNKANDFTGVCCRFTNASANITTKSFVKQNLQYCERGCFVSDQFYPTQWNGGRRDELSRSQSQQPTFLNF